jgi:phenylalanyl-tRNA synthetase beta chain
MQFSESWLRTFVDPALSTDALSELLTMSGLEVEDCVPVAPPFTGVVVGHVLSVEKHPDADRLNVCKVDAGTGTPLDVVCGAPNVAPGMKAPLAMVGAALPGDFRIKAAKVRGVESRGMLCSSRELGLSDDHAGLLVLAADAPVGRPLREWLGLDDHVFTIKLTPNRADCLSVLGVAREVSALSGAPLLASAVAPVAPASDARHPFGTDAPEGCGRFAGRVIRNVNAAAPTPDWMKQRLERAGQRSISALVDVTNYVMLEMGRPLHVYDLDKLRGRVGVRFAGAGERLVLLNGQDVALDPDVLCIVDDRGPIGMAGVMGGDSTKAETTTRNVFLESAFFTPEVIAGRARRYNFTSDASHRFERGVDFASCVEGIERATRLILDICGGEAGPTEDRVAQLPARPPVRMRTERARKVIGVAIPDADMMAILGRLGLAPRAVDGAIEITPPSFRFDLAIEEDVIEEIARVWGFDRIPAVPPRAVAAMRSPAEARRSVHDLRDRLVACDYQEVVNFSFVDAQWETDFGTTTPIRLLNPIASQLAVMRSTLIGGLVANVRYNLNRGLRRIRVFEAGRVFRRDDGVSDGPLAVAGIAQPTRIAALAYGPALEEQWGIADKDRAVDFFDVKGDLVALLSPLRATFVRATHPALHPGRSAQVLIDGVAVGWIGELHPRHVQAWELGRAPVVFELDVEPLLATGLPIIEEVPKVPAVERDIAMLFPESVSLDAVLAAIDKARAPIVKHVRLFDLYRGSGVAESRKSLALRVVMQDTARTLTDAEIDAAMAGIQGTLEAAFGATLRQ